MTERFAFDREALRRMARGMAVLAVAGDEVTLLIQRTRLYGVYLVVHQNLDIGE